MKIILKIAVTSSELYACFMPGRLSNQQREQQIPSLVGGINQFFYVLLYSIVQEKIAPHALPEFH